MGDIQNQLRRNGKIDLGEKTIHYGGEWMLLKPGDKYLAEVDGEQADVLTVRRVEVQKRRTTRVDGKVFPKERKKKLYNLHEVIKVVISDNPNYIKKETSERNVGSEETGSFGGDSKGLSQDSGKHEPDPKRSNGDVGVDVVGEDRKESRDHRGDKGREERGRGRGGYTNYAALAEDGASSRRKRQGDRPTGRSKGAVEGSESSS